MMFQSLEAHYWGSKWDKTPPWHMVTWSLHGCLIWHFLLGIFVGGYFLGGYCFIYLFFFFWGGEGAKFSFLFIFLFYFWGKRDVHSETKIIVESTRKRKAQRTVLILSEKKIRWKKKSCEKMVFKNTLSLIYFLVQVSLQSKIHLASSMYGFWNICKAILEKPCQMAKNLQSGRY